MIYNKLLYNRQRSDQSFNYNIYNDTARYQTGNQCGINCDVFVYIDIAVIINKRSEKIIKIGRSKCMKKIALLLAVLMFVFTGCAGNVKNDPANLLRVRLFMSITGEII